MRSIEEVNLLEYRQTLTEALKIEKAKDFVDLKIYKYLTRQINLVTLKLVDNRKAKLFGSV